MKKLIPIIAMGALLLKGCAGDGETHPEFKSSKVIENGVEKTPEWATTGAKAMWV